MIPRESQDLHKVWGSLDDDSKEILPLPISGSGFLIFLSLGIIRHELDNLQGTDKSQQ